MKKQFVFSLMDKATARAIQACLDFARQEFTPQHFLLYVFPWNKRAIRVYERVGFQPVRSYVQRNSDGGHEFVEMSRDV
ncbi:GNAT family N-acetyltransferase [Ktedonobacteria bacterium brp13]|nr:GNAT family N-acetyltransferase [Ktedonobacteria bacterium brp13]